MDTIQAVAKKMENVTVNRFLVSGASKVRVNKMIWAICQAQRPFSWHGTYAKCVDPDQYLIKIFTVCLHIILLKLE